MGDNGTMDEQQQYRIHQLAAQMRSVLGNDWKGEIKVNLGPISSTVTINMAPSVMKL